jgi:galactokinase
VALAKIAREAGAQAASAFGAGFGGSVWALIESEKVDRFLIDWAAAYGLAYSSEAQRAGFYSSQAGPAAFALAQ